MRFLHFLLLSFFSVSSYSQVVEYNLLNRIKSIYLFDQLSNGDDYSIDMAKCILEFNSPAHIDTVLVFKSGDNIFHYIKFTWKVVYSNQCLSLNDSISLSIVLPILTLNVLINTNENILYRIKGFSVSDKCLLLSKSTNKEKKEFKRNLNW
jgi:hypothetical protein